jgi:hypothetical protein
VEIIASFTKLDDQYDLPKVKPTWLPQREETERTTRTEWACNETLLNLAFGQGMAMDEKVLRNKLREQISIYEELNAKIALLEDEISHLYEAEDEFEFQEVNTYHERVIKERKLKLSKPQTLPLKVRI